MLSGCGEFAEAFTFPTAASVRCATPGARDCIDHIVREMEEVGVRGDGSPELGRYIRLKLCG